MRARRLIPPLTMLALLLAGCASAPQQTAPPVAAVKSSASTAAARKADIRRQIAAVCPTPLSPSDLDRAESVVERHQVDRDVIAVVGRLDRMDRETRICRGIK